MPKVFHLLVLGRFKSEYLTSYGKKLKERFHIWKQQKLATFPFAPISPSIHHLLWGCMGLEAKSAYFSNTLSQFKKKDNQIIQYKTKQKHLETHFHFHLKASLMLTLRKQNEGGVRKDKQQIIWASVKTIRAVGGGNCLDLFWEALQHLNKPD